MGLRLVRVAVAAMRARCGLRIMKNPGLSGRECNKKGLFFYIVVFPVGKHVFDHLRDGYAAGRVGRLRSCRRRFAGRGGAAVEGVRSASRSLENAGKKGVMYRKI